MSNGKAKILNSIESYERLERIGNKKSNSQCINIVDERFSDAHSALIMIKRKLCITASIKSGANVSVKKAEINIVDELFRGSKLFSVH